MKPDLHQRRDLAHLICAENAIESAREAIHRLTTEVGSDLTNPLFTTLQEVVIIGYGRAFSEMRPFGRLDKTTRWAVFTEPNRQALHDRLMQYRNQMVAHTDFKPDSILVNPPGALRSDGNKQHSSAWGVEPVTVWLAPQYYHDIQMHLDSLGGQMQGTIQAHVNQIFGGSTATTPFELLSQTDLDTLKAEGKKKPTS